MSWIVWTVGVALVAFVGYLLTEHDDRHTWRGIHVFHWVFALLTMPLAWLGVMVGTSSPRPRRTDTYRDGSGLGNPDRW